MRHIRPPRSDKADVGFQKFLTFMDIRVRSLHKLDLWYIACQGINVFWCNHGVNIWRWHYKVVKGFILLVLSQGQAELDQYVVSCLVVMVYR
jgi:hypothetical protein